ncbi:hypothetical protein MBANPS3_001004 [Mucor bainieri]
MFHSFPKEVLLGVFGHVESLADLTQCRLVCKCWSDVAEEAMFSHTITLKSNAQAMVLFAHLFGRSHYARRITHIHFDSGYMKKSYSVLRTLLDLAFTSNMKRLSGNVNEEFFYRALGEVASANGERTFSHLTTIPFQEKQFTALYSMALLRFKDTLTSVTIRAGNDYPDDHLWTFVSRLSEFVHLEEFCYGSRLRDILEVDTVLRECKHVRVLILDVLIDTSRSRGEQLEPWLGSSVEQMSNLHKLTIINECVGEFLTYLVYKYPRVQEIALDATLSRLTTDSMTTFMANMDQVLAAIAKGCTVVIKKVMGDDYVLLKIEGL